MHFSDPKDQAEFDARHSGLGVLLCHPNEHTKSRILKEEIRQALREGKILFLVGKKKLVDRTSQRCNQLLRVDGL